ncbi:MAG: class I SAM-dependent methyltransferase, partial [Planctomycetota bacterium]
LRKEADSEVNTEEIIETAYDLQSGSYVASLAMLSFRQHKQDYGEAIAKLLKGLLPEGGSVLEPGVGEGTTLSFVKKSCGVGFGEFHGFDISWSRIATCREWLAAQKMMDVFLAVASIFHAPYQDNSFDVVYTSHTVEPNGGQEFPILKELYRIASRYLVLLEPGYELASDEAQERMRRLGYVRGLKDKAENLGMRVVRHELFPMTANPLNPTALTVIEKNRAARSVSPQLACPRYGDSLQNGADSLYSSGSMRAYPKILGIPCLRVEDGIIASQYFQHAQSAGHPGPSTSAVRPKAA